ncbi:MAG: FAD-dependent oxidoreductase [Chthoniobacter sp.]
MKRLIALLLALAPWLHAATECDVIVYGATPSGCCAAIAAAREGESVILLEPTDHIGGVNTGGLCFSDSNQTVRSTVLGLFEEWHSRVEKDYQERGVELPYKVSEKDQRPWTYEPHVAMRITKAMLAEAKVQVLPRHALKSVDKEGAQIRQIVTSDGEFRAKVFIDATYEGDLMAAAGVSWTIGRESRAEFGESLAGRQYPKVKLPISGLDAAGKMLPLITTTDAGPTEEGDRRVMVYSFRLCLTKEAANRAPFPEPAHYDPARFEVVRRYFAQEKKPVLLWDLYPLPGGKFDANNGIGKQFSMGLVGAGMAGAKRMKPGARRSGKHTGNTHWSYTIF